MYYLGIFILNMIHCLQIRCNWAVLYFTQQPDLVKRLFDLKKCGFSVLVLLSTQGHIRVGCNIKVPTADLPAPRVTHSVGTAHTTCPMS